MKFIIFLGLLVGNILTYANPIIIGVLPFAPPYTSSVGKDNHYYGFCVDLMNEICARIHEDCQYKSTEFDQQLNDLRSGAIDLTFLASPIQPSDNLDYLYSLPYLPSKGQFLTLENSKITSLDELKDKKIGVLQSSFLKKNFLNRYISQENIHEYPNLSQLISAMNAHEIDAALLNDGVSKYLNINMNMHLLGNPIDFGMGYGISAMKNNAALIDKINKALLKMQEDGAYAKIYNKYFGN